MLPRAKSELHSQSYAFLRYFRVTTSNLRLKISARKLPSIQAGSRKRDIKASFRNLGHSIIKLECTLGQFHISQKAELEKTDTPPPTTPRKRGRIGSGLHGKRTKRMEEQLTEFINFIKEHPIYNSDKSRTLGARANKFWNLNVKSMNQAKKASGEMKGFTSSKSLANAYRNSK